MKRLFYRRNYVYEDELFNGSIKRIHREALKKTVIMCIPVYIILLIIIIYTIDKYK
jgi:hypothetical protein